MCWRRALARRAMPSAWIAEAMQAQGHARGVPVFKRTLTCADLVDRRGAGLRGFQLGSLAERAAMRRLILRSLKVRSLRAHLGCLAALQVLEGSASPPHGGGLLWQPGQAWLRVSVPEGAVGVPGQRCHKGHGGRQAADQVGRNVFVGEILAEARPATQVGWWLGVPIARELYIRS